MRQNRELSKSSCAKPRYRPAISMDCKIAEGMVTFFESYVRELEKYWTKTLFFQPPLPDSSDARRHQSAG